MIKIRNAPMNKNCWAGMDRVLTRLVTAAYTRSASSREERVCSQFQSFNGDHVTLFLQKKINKIKGLLSPPPPPVPHTAKCHSMFWIRHCQPYPHKSDNFYTLAHFDSLSWRNLNNDMALLQRGI